MCGFQLRQQLAVGYMCGRASGNTWAMTVGFMSRVPARASGDTWAPAVGYMARVSVVFVYRGRASGGYMSRVSVDG